MADELFVPLVLLDCGAGEIRGKVRLQKLIFLVQQRYAAIDYEFEPAPLGPLSYKLTNVMFQLQHLGLAREETEHTQSGHAIFCYYLTERGRSLLKVVRNSRDMSDDLQTAIRETHRAYGSMKYLDLLQFVHREYPDYHIKGISLKGFEEKAGAWPHASGAAQN